MINKNEPLSMAEVSEYVKSSENRKDLKKFIKDFSAVKSKDAIELRKKLEALDLMKLKANDISKIIDIMPQDEEDLNKIFVDVRLDGDESKKILDTIKEFS